MIVEVKGSLYDVNFAFTPDGCPVVENCVVVADNHLPSKGVLFVQNKAFSSHCKDTCPKECHVHVHPLAIRMLGEGVL